MVDHSNKNEDAIKWYCFKTSRYSYYISWKNLHVACVPNNSSYCYSCLSSIHLSNRILKILSFKNYSKYVLVLYIYIYIHIMA